jgi:hypothetical protein
MLRIPELAVILKIEPSQDSLSFRSVPFVRDVYTSKVQQILVEIGTLIYWRLSTWDLYRYVRCPNVATALNGEG